MKTEQYEICEELLGALSHACLSAQDCVCVKGAEHVGDRRLRRNMLEDLGRVFAGAAEKLHEWTYENGIRRFRRKGGFLGTTDYIETNGEEAACVRFDGSKHAPGNPSLNLQGCLDYVEEGLWEEIK